MNRPTEITYLIISLAALTLGAALLGLGILWFGIPITVVAFCLLIDSFILYRWPDLKPLIQELKNGDINEFRNSIGIR